VRAALGSDSAKPEGSSDEEARTRPSSFREEDAFDKGTHPEKVSESITRRADDVAREEKEPGRYDAGRKGASERPVGKSTARDRTGVDPQDPIDEESPQL
jgi:hypothetical protein